MAEVELHLYDLSSGLCRTLSKTLLGKQVDGVWHTGIVLRGLEYYYGAGIQIASAGQTQFGRPLQVLSLGTTQIPDNVFQDYLTEMRETWTPAAYSLFDNNCNHFTEEVATFLTGEGIPDYILALPQEVLSTVFGRMLAPSLAGVQGQLNSPPRTAHGTPFEAEPQDLTSSVTDSLRAAAVTVVTDTGMSLEKEAMGKLSEESKDVSMQQLHAASQGLSSKKHEVAAGLSRAALGRENVSVRGVSPGPSIGFPAPATRRLATAKSGEIIARLGSGQFNHTTHLARPATAGEPKLPPVQELSRRASTSSITGPKEPQDGTRAAPGPSSAKNVGLNAKVSYDLQRTNSGLKALAKQDFEVKVRQEVANIMAKGGASAHEAVAQAIDRASAVTASTA